LSARPPDRGNPGRYEDRSIEDIEAARDYQDRYSPSSNARWEGVGRVLSVAEDVDADAGAAQQPSSFVAMSESKEARFV